MWIIKLLLKLSKTHKIRLYKANMILESMGKPRYYLSNGGFHADYRLDVKTKPPRFVMQWKPPFIRLTILYLYYIPNSNELIQIKLE